MCCRRHKRHVTEVSSPSASHRYNSSKLHTVSTPCTAAVLRLCSFADSTLLYPVGVSALSALVLLVQSILHRRAQKQKYAKLVHSGPPRPVPSDESHSEDARPSALARHVKEHGGTVIFAFNAARAASTLALLGLYIYTALTFSSHRTNTDGQGFEAASYATIGVAFVSAACS